MNRIGNKKLVVMAAGILGMASMSLAAEDRWTQKSDMHSRVGSNPLPRGGRALETPAYSI